jgi:hypothetical protein
LLGVPLAWAITFGVEFLASGLLERSNAIQNWNSPIARVVGLLLSSAWLGPMSGENDWIIPSATLVLLVPFFFASYAVEYFVVRLMVGMRDDTLPVLTMPRVRVAVRNANLVTYGAMFVGTSIWLVVLFARR